MRSQLFVPADSEKKLEKSLSTGADCLLIDLEDSVALAAKPRARAGALAFLREVKTRPRPPLLYVRVNAFDSGLIDDDIDVVMQGAPDGILLPKTRSGADVQHLGAKLAVREAECGYPDGATKIIAIATETAASIFHMGTYAGASRRLAGLTWGAEDLAAVLGAEANRLPDGSYASPYALARTLTLFAANAAEVLAIDTIYADFRDAVGFRAECEAARRDGFTAKMAIHPGQVETINEIFTPSADSLAKAQAIVATFAADPEAGVVSIDGKMIDRPHLTWAQRILARAPS
jgi:citrate lyase subunit beta / citryl-CoA lyase